MSSVNLQEIYQFVLEKRELWRKLSDSVWNNPELAYQEKFACAEQVKLLQSLGFEVRTPFAGLDTAYFAEWGKGEVTFAFAAEYDALPEVGHGCGHNLICTAAIAAGYAAMNYMRKHGISGRIAVIGTPAEENAGGKVKMVEQNCLDKIDAVMMVHPNSATLPDTGSTAMDCYDVTFRGHSAHAAASPELGLNALDAVMLCFSAINAWRQQLPEHARIHGIVTSGGAAPNIIPDYASCRIYLRSSNEAWIEKMRRRFREIVHGAEIMTGTKGEITPCAEFYKSRNPNSEMNARFIENAEILGMNPVKPANPGRGSSDFGNFSHEIPGIHPYFGISKEKIPAHSPEFAAAAKSGFAFEEMMKAAAAMTATGMDFIADSSFRAAVQTAFEKSL